MKAHCCIRLACASARTCWEVPWPALGALLALVLGTAGALGSEVPRILGMEHRGSEWVIRVSVPPGVARVVIEACRRDDLLAWIPRATARVTPHETEVTFSLEPDPRMEFFRVRADTSDPLPAEWYTGLTRFLAESATDPVVSRRNDDERGTLRAARSELGATVESDITRVRGDTLYFFNELRGLQVIDLAHPGGPKLQGTLPLPGSGEQLYLAGKDHAVVLMHDPCRQWSVEAESAVSVIDTQAMPPVETVRIPLKGRIVESRWVGEALYVATETWETVNDGSGSWRAGTQVASFDFTSPEAPIARGTLWFPGAGNVVTATDQFLFVAVTDYSRGWPWESVLEVLDIAAPDGTVATWVQIPLSGRVPDPFKIDLLDDTLRMVVEAVETPDAQRWVTVLETYRLSDPRSASPLPVALLDRLELARGERLLATRFDGTRGYVVTSDRADPLWLIDLSDPTDLRVAGEVEIPGWSNSLRPMGDRLLTFGLDDAQGTQVAVQLFDVSNPRGPALLAKVPLGDNASWNEATSDEKAFGMFQESCLVVVPVSEWKDSGIERGVQLLDFGRDTLTRRGLLKSAAWVPRRAILHRDSLLTISGRALVRSDIENRDQPGLVAAIELAYPVERVLLVGEHLLEFHANSVRVRRHGGIDAGVSVDLGDLSVLGAREKGGRIHLLQGRGAKVSWNYDEATATWTGRTNQSGVLLASVWDASHLPALTKIGEGLHSTDLTSVGDAEGFWLRDDLLLWASTTPLRGRWELEGVGAEDASMDSLAVVGGGFWQPWQGNLARHLTAVDVSDAAAPVIRSELILGGNGRADGTIAHAGTLVFSSRRRMESEMVGTQHVVEMAQFPGVPHLLTHTMVEADGTVWPEVLVRNEGEWWSVTHGYPIVRWWTHHELDVVDYGAGGARPVIRPPVLVPGELEGIARDGALVFTTGWVTVEDGSPIATLDASAYDGVAAHQIDRVRIANGAKAETYAVAVRGEVAYVARGGWGGEANQRLEAWSLGSNGKWLPGAVTGLGMVPNELRWFGSLLLARNGGEFDFFRSGARGEIESVPVAQVPGCFSGDLGRADGDAARGVWLPFGEHGAIRIGP